MRVVSDRLHRLAAVTPRRELGVAQLEHLVRGDPHEPEVLHHECPRRHGVVPLVRRLHLVGRRRGQLVGDERLERPVHEAVLDELARVGIEAEAVAQPGPGELERLVDRDRLEDRLAVPDIDEELPPVELGDDRRVRARERDLGEDRVRGVAQLPSSRPIIDPNS
jgi:hypothetical protein